MRGEYQMGKPLETVLRETRERLQSENFALFAAAVDASRQSGAAQRNDRADRPLRPGVAAAGAEDPL